MGALMVLNLKKEAPAFIPEASEADVKAFLAKKEMIECCAFKARIDKKHCAEFHLKAVANARSFEATVLSSYRKPCIDCEIGKKQAAKVKIKVRACKLCGRDTTSQFEKRNRTGLCHYCRSEKQKNANHESRAALKAIFE